MAHGAEYHLGQSGKETSNEACRDGESFLQDCFLPFLQFNFDRVKELTSLEKEKTTRISQSPLWASLLNVINHLSVAEKNYLALTFLEQKWFGRKESGKGIYTQATAELHKVELRRSSRHQQFPDPLENLIIHIADQLVQYVRAKQEMMDFYIKLCGLGLQKVEADFTEMTMALQSICQRYAKAFHHPLLAPLRSSWNYETEILSSLLQARVEMSGWRFLPSLLKLNDAHSKLEGWGAPIKAKEPKKKLSALVSVKNNSMPSLICWLLKYYLALLSKFSFYFHETLSEQAAPTDVKSHLTNLSMDYYSKIVTFQRKTDTNYIILVFDTHGCEYTGHGYHFPVGYTEPPKGLDSFPAVFSYPKDKPKPIHLWPNVVMLLSEPSSSTAERPVYFYDGQQQITYFIVKVDIKMSLLLVFETKKSEKDTNINNFLQDMVLCLRGTRLLSSLRQGSKN